MYLCPEIVTKLKSILHYEKTIIIGRSRYVGYGSV